jgi:hypothetical protein
MKRLAALAIVFLGFGCSSAVPPSPASSEPSSATTSRGLLGSLRTRDREVLLYASATGVKVTVKTPGGAMVAERVDLDTLRTTDPHLYEVCRSGLAKSGPYLDATLDSRMREPMPRDESPRAAPRGRP